jgi:hypothetical protein
LCLQPKRPARVRRIVRRSWHRALPRPTEGPPDQRDGRALQRPHHWPRTTSYRAKTSSKPCCVISDSATISYP